MTPEALFNHYKKSGFNFSKELLTRYCLSLYTKPFVILSGISGTGKTKIAQLFEIFKHEQIDVQDKHSIADDRDYIVMNVTEGVRNGDGRGNFKFEDLEKIFNEVDIRYINSQIDIKKTEGTDDNIIEPRFFKVKYKKEYFDIGIYLQRANSPLVRVRFKSKIGDAKKYNSQPFLHQYFQVNDKLKLKKMKDEIDVLEVVSVNDEKVKEEYERDKLRTQKDIVNKLFISVKSNWTDNTELFGYYNVLDEKYYVTPLLKFVLTAKDNPEIPFFLVLDEMNLSRVEHYFSDFLSCLESRFEVDGRLVQEQVHLHNFPHIVNSNDDYYDLIPSAIEIPVNLYVTGTVNIDETTYTFSPKVLDRANVIEFNEVNLELYGNEARDEFFVLKDVPEFNGAVLATMNQYTKTPQQFKDCVKSLLEILKPYNLHFGYRVINEMSLFINNAMECVGTKEAIINKAIDIQICQKVLPKFNGAFGKLDEPIRKLIEFLIIQPELDYQKIDLKTIENMWEWESPYPESFERLCKLYKNLVANGFASFLE